MSGYNWGPQMPYATYLQGDTEFRVRNIRCKRAQAAFDETKEQALALQARLAEAPASKGDLDISTSTQADLLVDYLGDLGNMGIQST